MRARISVLSICLFFLICLPGHLFAQVAESGRGIVPKTGAPQPPKPNPKAKDDSIAFSQIESYMMDSPVYPSGVGNAEDLPVITIYDLIKAAIEIGKDEGIHVRIFPSNATRFGLTKDRYVSLIYGGLLSGFQVVDPRKTAITLKVTCNLVINELSGPMCSNAKVQVNGENVSVADAFTKNPVFLRAMRDTDSVPWKAAN